GEIIEVRVQPLAKILKGHHLNEIDFISLDVEGAELDVLGAFPFDEFRVTAWTVENNTYNPEIPKLMRSKGYKRVEMIAADDVYLYDPS
ncbi:MAG: FkbM family methyltransferase, partial [Pseudomonadota bacterium]